MRNEILELSFEFALDIIEFAEQLEEKRKFVVANQILKSGTSIGEDNNITRRIKDGCNAVGINMLDHIIIARGQYYSFADEGKV